MRHPIAVALASLALGAALPAAATRAETTDQWQRTYDVTGRAALRVVTDDGSVRVHTWDRHAMSVRIATTGWTIGNGGVRVEEDRSGGRVEVQAHTPTWTFHFGFSRHKVMIDVWVPPAADLTLETGDGGVDVAAVNGRLVVRTGDGPIHVEGAHGELRLHSGDGTILGRGLDGTIEAGTGDGAIRIDGRFDELSMNSGDGDIVAEAGSGSTLRSGWSVSTSDGRVTMRVPADLKAELDAHTGDGGIEVDLPVTIMGRVSRSNVRGALNGGGPMLRLRSGDGSIRIEAL